MRTPSPSPPGEDYKQAVSNWLGSKRQSKNRFIPGEPVKWNKSIINVGYVSAILINSGNANVFTGDKGKKSLEKIISKLGFSS